VEARPTCRNFIPRYKLRWRRPHRAAGHACARSHPSGGRGSEACRRRERGRAPEAQAVQTLGADEQALVSLSRRQPCRKLIRRCSGRSARAVCRFPSVSLTPSLAPGSKIESPTATPAIGQAGAAVGNDAGQTALEPGTAKVVRGSVADSEWELARARIPAPVKAAQEQVQPADRAQEGGLEPDRTNLSQRSGRRQRDRQRRSAGTHHPEGRSRWRCGH